MRGVSTFLQRSSKATLAILLVVSSLFVINIGKASAAPGDVDTTFTGLVQTGGYAVNKVIPHPVYSGAYIIVGSFTQYAGQPAHRIVVVDSAGNPYNVNGLNSAFQGTQFNGEIRDIAAGWGGRLAVVGGFTQRGSTQQSNISIINSYDGSMDAPVYNNIVGGWGSGGGPAHNTESVRLNAVAFVGGSYDAMVVGGNFSNWNNTGYVDFIAFQNGATGPLTNGTFGYTTSGEVQGIKPYNDGSARAIVYGNFGAYIDGSEQHNMVFRWDSTTNNPESNFNVYSSNFSGSGYTNGVRSAAIQSDGKVLLGGYWQGISGVKDRLIRVTPTAAPDSTFMSGGSGVYNISPKAIYVDDAKGHIYVSGRTNYGYISDGAETYTPATNIFRINMSNGRRDASFNPSAGDSDNGLGMETGAEGMWLDGTKMYLWGAPIQSYAGYNTVGVARIKTLENVVEFGNPSTSSTNESTNNFTSLIVTGVLSSSATVQIAAVSGSATGGGVDYSYSTQTVTIPAGTYSNTGVSIPVQPSLVQDSLVEGTENINFQLQSASGINIGDATGNSSTQSIFTYNITDDDTASFTKSSTAATTAESGGTATFTVQLGAQPTSNVVISIASSATGEATVSPATLTFTNANWNTPQTVTVTGVNDLIDRNDTATITLSIVDASSNDFFDPLADQTVAVTLTDDDTAGVTVSESSVDITEGGTTDTYTLVLNSQPTSLVAVNHTANIEANRAPSPVTFTTSNWNVPQTVTVTAVDDTEVEDAHNATLAHSVTSSDTTYNGLSVASVTANITDNEYGFTVTPSGGSNDVAEGGATDTYDVVLNAAPSASVTVMLTPNTQVSTNASSLTFTTSNWNTPQTVTVNAVDDSAVEGAHSGSISYSVASSDTNYNGFTVTASSVNVTDNDTASFTRTPSTRTINENGGSSTFTVVLDKQPLTNVVFDITSSSTSEATVSVGSLTFTSINWNTPQTVTITGVDDAIDRDDSATVTVAVNDASSDNAFDPLADQTVAVILTDNDMAGFTLVQSGGTTNVSESATTDTFTVVLTSQPTSNVVVDLSSSATSEATVAPSSVTFTPSNWNTPQTVTVTGINDANDDGDQNAIITASVNDSSSANEYDPLADQTVGVINADNDYTVNVSVAPSAGGTITATGINCGNAITDCTEAKQTGSTTLLTPSPATGYTTGSWSGDCTGTSCTIGASVTTTQTVTYTFLVDTDQDGVADVNDTVCTNTTSGLAVDANGCPTLAAIIGASNSPANGGYTTDDLKGLGLGDVDPDKLPFYEDAFASTSPAPTTPAAVQSIVDGVNVDLDQDGTPDSTDQDIDGDGTANENESDSDGDGIPNATDVDDDNDGIDDTSDPAPVGPTATDTDADGNSNAVEDLAPNGDGNYDGIPDKQQPNVTSAVNPITGKINTMQATGQCRVVGGYKPINSSSISKKDSGFTYPVGMSEFVLTCDQSGDSSTVKFFLDKVYDTSKWVQRKYVERTNSYIDISAITTYGVATVNGVQVTTISYTIQDGSSLTDDDGMANRVIPDPSGPAVANVTTGSPNTGLEKKNALLPYVLITSSLALGYVVFRRYAKTSKK